VPIDGVCKTRTDPEVAAAGCTKTGGTDLTDTEKSCEQCGTGYFLHSGGCYSTAEGKPGRALCTTAGEGVCTQGAEGYFAVPGATKTDESVVACGDTTGVTVSTNKKYVGVDSCSKCSAPQAIKEPNGGTAAATCTECSNSKIVKTDNGVTSCVDPAECKDGFFVDATSTPNKCTACTDDNCDVCAASGANKCSKCKTDGTKIYLQKEADSQTGTCVNKAGCTGTNYIDEAAKTCSTCASAGTTGCKTCAKTDGVVACASCEDGQKFGLNKKSCVKECPENSSKQNDTCVCNDGFTPNEDSSECVVTSSSVNLSTGAIAGISVATVIVIRGLVGLLCWRSACRVKKQTLVEAGSLRCIIWT
ncbi:Variant-specific surface protein, partial [Giardia duodenalis]